ncbi:MAG: dephospho-CoA kinase [Oscillospiraceae bacterium]
MRRRSCRWQHRRPILRCASPKTADDACVFRRADAAVIDGGPCGIGRESTLVDLSCTPYRILRSAAVPDDAVWDALVRRMHIVGITGGTGCGKTTALTELERQGALVIDCDAVYHELLASNAAMLAEINARFPGTIEMGCCSKAARRGRVCGRGGA